MCMHEGDPGSIHDINSAIDSTGESDLRTSILKEIGSSAYVCLVCTDYITPSSKVWSCYHCYRVFDLDCIKDWALRGSSTQDDRSWRCPSCNHSHEKIPKIYTCWCGKSINPTLNVLEPHSCGNICGSPLAGCLHECSLPCHPGPHIEKCTALGPVLKCHCGKHSKQLPCILTSYDNGWGCEEICDDILSCGIHRCKSKCHSGFCDDCDRVIDVQCYCGKSHESIECNERLPKKSEIDGKSWIGNFECDEPCEELFDCGIHKCLLNCHQITKEVHKCPNSPTNLIYCPCGKHKIDELLENPRKTCLDPIPTCDSICGKRLPCGHKCYWKCHEGACAPCYRSVDIDCKCGFTHFSIACALKVQGYVPTCTFKCGAKFNCKRHYCTNICCEYRKIAYERSNLIKKQLRNNIITTSIVEQVQFEDVHTCDKECNQILSCGKHRCKATCHPGACGPCLESSSDDLVCNCGRTIVPAPVRCGTVLPPCPYQCIRPKECGHRLEPHHCHEDNISCPKCTMLVTKRCQCEKHNLVANVMCYQDQLNINEEIDQGETSYIPHIPCDEVCEKERRNKLLFDALGLNPARAKDAEVSLKMRTIESIYTPLVLNLYAKQRTWSSSIEEIFNQLLAHTIESSFKNLKNSEIKQSHHFRPMKQVQRKFIHELAESWGLFAESHDPEPRRSVSVKLLKTSQVPDIGLKEAHEIYERYKAIEKKKAMEKSMREPSLPVENKIAYYNGIIIKDVFFGITVETVDAAIYDLWNKTMTDEEGNESKVFSLIKNGRVEFIRENMYIFYGDDCGEDERLQQQDQIKELCSLLDSRVTEKRLALKCVLAKIDITDNAVLEISDCNGDDESNIRSNSKFEENTENLVNVENSLEDLKIEATTVSSEWW
ncbi:FKBP12-associated protein [Pichia californica]|uniref:FKBP12-associated protein n=1 Tax=Pichia californica TaxID=460514 RepID=A0A9P6WN13_9ASCO|nr:FKBP12-associated protein [[Candida] californica]